MKPRRTLRGSNVLKMTFVLVLVMPGSGLAFDTLDGDSTRWPNTPNYSIGRLNPELDAAGQRQAIMNAFRAWSSVRGVDLPMAERVRGADITVDVLDRWPPEFGPSAAGVTVTTRRFGRISRAEISLNDQHFDWALAGDDTLADMQGVTTHEVGHAIGLGHSFYRDSTMYWSDSGPDLRQLSDDDERGVRYLYAPGVNGEGRLCDHCENNDDCMPGAFCLALEENRAFCGQPCDGGCPEHTECYQLRGGAQSCVPSVGGCSDEAHAGFNEGDYCFGSDQCGADMACIVLPGTARCVRYCRPGGNDCPDGVCVGGEGAGEPGLCLRPGDSPYGAPCETDIECEAFSCIPNAGGASVCAGACQPGRDACPEGECIATGNPVQPGICIPPGNAREGNECGTFEDRCAAGLFCINEGDGVRCRQVCEPFGFCPNGFGCSPVSDEVWLCFPQNPNELGTECGGQNTCGGGHLCAPIGTRRADVCAEICRPGDPNACGPATCIDFGIEFGVCPLGSNQIGDSCDSEGQCLGGHCVWSPNGSICSVGCDGDGDCPNDWSCRRYGNDRQACFLNDASNNPGGMGGSSGQGGASGSSMGGSNGMAGEPGFPVTPDEPNMNQQGDAAVPSMPGPSVNGQPNPNGSMNPNTTFDAGIDLYLLPGEDPQSGCQAVGNARPGLPMFLLVILVFLRPSRRE